MPPRTRKLVATLVLLPALGAYVAGAIVLADLLPSHWLIDLAYFVVAGVGWAFPARLLLRWAEKAPTPRPSGPGETRP